MGLAGRHAATAIVVGALVTIFTAGCASPGGTGAGNPEPPGSGGRDVTLHVTVGRAPQPLQVPRGSRVTVLFPPNPQGTWTSPKLSDPGVAHTRVRRSPAGVTMEIHADAAGTTRVAVYTTPSGDPRPPGRAPATDWILHLTVTG